MKLIRRTGFIKIRGGIAGSDATDRNDRLSFLKIDDATRSALRDFWPAVEPRLGAILERFYAHITAIPELGD